MKTLSLLALFAVTSFGQLITWQDLGPVTGSSSTPTPREWLGAPFDTQHGLGLYWMSSQDQSPTIYSGAMWGLNSVTHTFTQLWEKTLPGTWAGGTTYAVNQYVMYMGTEYISLQNANAGNTPPTGGGSTAWWQPFDCDTPTPMRRHPYNQGAWDSTSNKFWQFDGVCGGGTHPLDTITFSSSGTTNTGSWSALSPADSPGGGGFDQSAMTYDPLHDALWQFGGLTTFGASPTQQLWLYCKHADPQSNGDTIGCTNGANDWSFVSVTGSSDTISNHILFWNGTQLMMYGGVNGGFINSVNVYTISTTTHVFTKLSPSGTAPPTNDAFAYAAWDSLRGHIVVVIDATHEYVYTAASNAWTAATLAGTPPDPTLDSTNLTNQGCSVTYDSTNDKYQAQCETDGNPTIHFYIGTPAAIVNVSATAQEAIYTGGTTGVTRTNDPLTFSVPFADADGVTGAGIMGLSGPPVGQFRCLGTYASGNCKWMQVDTQVSFAAGSNTTFSVTGGSGNFGGSNICTDPGGATAITCATGAITATIKKANFNGLDTLSVGATSIVATSSSANRGFMVWGPANPGVTCGTCVTQFSSANDSGSTSVVEENGPVRAVVKSIANLTDGSGNVYMHITVRQYFYLNQTRVRTVTVLRNADYGISSSFASAYKGHQGFEYRISPSITGTLTATFANETGTPTTTTLNQAGGTDSAYLYVGETQTLNEPDWCSQTTSGPHCVPQTNDIGYTIVKNGTNQRGGSSVITAMTTGSTTVLALTGSPLLNTLTIGGQMRVTAAAFSAGTGCTGINTPPYSAGVTPGPNTTAYELTITNISGQNVTVAYDSTGCTYTASSGTAWSDTQYPQGWADISDSGGKGMTIGVYQLSGYGMKSLEFQAGGSDVRIGILAAENTQPYYAVWPSWQISDQYLDFHTSAPVSLPNNFLRYQHYLLGRVPVAQYNSAGVFQYPMATASQEDTQFVAAQAAENLPSKLNPIATATNATPIVIGFTAGSFPGFTSTPAWSTGNQITITGATGNTAANGTWTLSQVDSLHYSLNGSTGNGTYTANSGSAAGVNVLSISTSCCIYDRGLTNVNGIHLSRYYFYAWPSGSGTNQADNRLSDLMIFLKRGSTTGCLTGSPLALSTCTADGNGSHFAGRWLDASHFYRFEAETSWAHADGFTWRSHPADVDTCGWPSLITSTNSTLAMNLWNYCANMEEHYHTYGVLDYYFLSGDETIRESIEGFPTNASGGLKDLFLGSALVVQQNGSWGNGPNGSHASTSGGMVTLSSGEVFPASAGSIVGYPLVVNNVTYTVTGYTSNTQVTVLPAPGTQTGPLTWAYDGGLFNTRSIGAYLMWTSRFYKWLSAVSDTDASTVLASGKNLFAVQVKPDICVGPGGTVATSFPTGCTVGSTNWPAAPSGSTQGVSRVRGWHWGNAGGSAETNCAATTGPSDHGRGWSLLFNNNLGQGVWELAQASGTSWVDYYNALDLTYGISQAMLTEGYAYDGTPSWFDYGIPFNSNGFRFALFVDYPNLCDSDQQGYQGAAAQTIWLPFYINQQINGPFSSLNKAKYNINLQHLYAALPGTWTEYGGYGPSYVAYALNNASMNALQSLTITSIIDDGDGTYHVSWVTPTGTTGLRVKYGCLVFGCTDGQKTFVENIGYDAGNNVFIGNPISTINWWAAQNATSIPAPVPGTQTMVVNAGRTGLAAFNFSVKAMAPQLGGGTGGFTMLGPVRRAGPVTSQ